MSYKRQKDSQPRAKMRWIYARKADTSNDRQQRDELHYAEARTQEDGGDEDGEQRGGRADDLVERDGDELETDVADCDVDGVQDGEGAEDEVFPLGESRRRLRLQSAGVSKLRERRTKAPRSRAM